MFRFAAALVVVTLTISIAVAAGPWPQFRGNSGGQAETEQKLPAQIGPDQNIIWKTALPPGHSSPVIHGDRVYLTAFRDKKLLTIAMDRASGKVVWEAEAPYKELEHIHQIGSYAQPTPVTDGELVISFFGSTGLVCHNAADGKQVWHLPLGPFKNNLGAGSSPLLVGDRVVLNQDHDIDSFLIAVDKKSGKVLWKVERPDFWVGYASPGVWEVDGKKQIVVPGSLRVVGYDAETGKEIWTVRGMARAMHMTPAVGPDNTLYVAGWTGGGDDGERIDVPPFDKMLAEQDKDKNGTLENDEIPAGPIKDRFSMTDRNKDTHVDKTEYEFMRKIFDAAQNRIVAIKPGGKGDISESHVLWSQKRYLPVIPSPLFYQGNIYLMRNGGIISVLDAKTGKAVRQERLFSGNYYSSPVAGDGKVYLISERGELTVMSTDPDGKVLSRTRFGEDAYGTPALVDGRIYLRTAGHLYCFGLK